MNFRLLIIFYRLADSVNSFKLFFGYVIIGLSSIILEKFIIDYFNLFQTYKEINFNYILLQICLILFSFYLNAKHNFKIPKNKWKISFISFLSISTFSGLIQYFLIIFTNINLFDFERFITSAITFPFIYLLHFNFSFRFRKKIGVPVYLNSMKNILDIYNKVGQNVDYIHIDIIDKTMKNSKSDNSLNNFRLAKTLWPTKKIESHIMSLNPEKWINLIYDESDTVFVHLESNYFKKSNIDNLKKLKKLGIVFLYNTSSTRIQQTLSEFSFIKNILVLCIKKPGEYGQKFQKKSYKVIDFINQLSNRSQINLVIDGGIDSDVNNNLMCENIVSGSYILGSIDSQRALIKLKV